MPNYAVRVELKGNPGYLEYEKLHQVMANLGFYKTVAGIADNGNQVSWNLPHALYFGFSNDDVATVRDKVAIAARTIQSGVIVFIDQSVTWAIGNY